MLPWKDDTEDNSKDETFGSGGEAKEECFGRRETALQVSPVCKRDNTVLGVSGRKNRICMAV